MNMAKSDFGKGFSYCIGLFLMHSERKEYEGFHLWFNGASDHLYDLEIPDCFSGVMKKRIETWQAKCLDWRLNKYNPADKKWAIDEARSFLMKYDKLNGVKAIKGTRE